MNRSQYYPGKEDLQHKPEALAKVAAGAPRWRIGRNLR
jgi:hypothetical protein